MNHLSPQLLTPLTTSPSSPRSDCQPSPPMMSRRLFSSLTRTTVASLRRRSWSETLNTSFTWEKCPTKVSCGLHKQACALSVGCSCRTSRPVPGIWPTKRPRPSLLPATVTVMARLELMVNEKWRFYRIVNYFFFEI